MADKLTKMTDDFSAWYNEIIQRAELADYAPVKGCMVIRPYGYAIWEHIQSMLDKKIKETGHVNAYFPLLIPESFLKKEKEHVEGFSPELAVVTHAGGKLLEEPLVIRPTSETVIYSMYSKWIKSYRDLPILINQWANIIRWEMRTRLFLRTTEFLWQEGHTAHETHDEAKSEVLKMLGVYREFLENDLCIPVISGRKTKSERFAGALDTFCVEAMMRDTKALQAGTSHDLGQNFAKAFDVKYLNRSDAEDFAWNTSWGVSTRLIGAIIMAHGDDQGLMLPPKVAPFQVVIVPIFKNDDEKKSVFQKIDEIKTLLHDFRIKVDDSEGRSPGFKFNEWEMRGVPLRIEIGPKDVAADQVMIKRRDIFGKDGKVAVSFSQIPDYIKRTLGDIEKSMFERAKNFRKDNTREITNYSDFKDTIEKSGGFIESYLCDNEACEGSIKKDTKATVRVILNESDHDHNCLYCNAKSTIKIVLAKSY